MLGPSLGSATSSCNGPTMKCNNSSSGGSGHGVGVELASYQDAETRVTTQGGDASRRPPCVTGRSSPPLNTSITNRMHDSHNATRCNGASVKGHSGASSFPLKVYLIPAVGTRGSNRVLRATLFAENAKGDVAQQRHRSSFHFCK